MLISSLDYLEDGPPRFTDVTNAEVEGVTAFSYECLRYKITLWKSQDDDAHSRKLGSREETI